MVRALHIGNSLCQSPRVGEKSRVTREAGEPHLNDTAPGLAGTVFSGL